MIFPDVNHDVVLETPVSTRTPDDWGLQHTLAMGATMRSLAGNGWNLQRMLRAHLLLLAMLAPPQGMAGGAAAPSGEDDGEGTGEGAGDCAGDCDCPACTKEREERTGQSKSQAGAKHSWKPFKRRMTWKGFFHGGDSPYEDHWSDDSWIMRPTRAMDKWTPPITGVHGDETAHSERPWMAMELQTPYLRTPKWAKGAGCTDTGSVFRAPWRLTTDQRVFRMNRAKRQGSVLLDTSGSMGLQRATVEKIVKAIPAAVIGIYSAESSDRGAVRVLAKGGRLVVADDQYTPIGGHNGVDGPALRWLGLQPQPRIWISDGMVTGIGDGSSPGLSRQAVGICERYRIRRVDTLPDALKLL